MKSIIIIINLIRVTTRSIDLGGMAGLVQVHFIMGITLMLFRYIFLSGFIMVNDIEIR